MIDTEALRKKIIDLAIQGKLTQQLPEDGDAEDLYVQIQKEKAKHIKEGKIKKEKSLPGITDEELPFEIPSNWKWIRLCDISETNIGLTYHPENIVDDGTIVLRSNNIVNGAFDYSDLVRVNCTVRDSQYIRENDILICSRNGSKRLVGKCAIYDGTYGDVSFGAFMAILRTPYFQYIYFYLLTDCFRRYFSSDDTKQINQVTQDILKKAIVPFPPISEQKRIVEKLEDILAQIDIVEALQQQFESDREILKGKIIDAGIRGKLTEQLQEDGNAEDLYVQIQEEKANLIKEGKIKKEKPLPEISDDEIPFEIPNNWKWVKLADLYEINPKVEAENESDAAFIPMEMIPAGFARAFSYEIQKWESAAKNHTKFKDGDVAFAKISPCFENRKSFVAQNLPGGVGGGTTELIVLRQAKVLPDYTYYIITDQRFINAGSQSYKGIVGQQRVKLDIIRNYPVALPPAEEQKRLTKRIGELLNAIA